MAHTNKRFSFLVEWYDPVASITKRYNLNYFPYDDAIEMFDIKQQKPFMRRIHCDTLKLEDLYKGSLVNVFSRQLRVVEFADEFTRKQLNSKSEATLAIIKPSAVRYAPEILEEATRTGLLITKLQMCHLKRRDAQQLYQRHAGKNYITLMIANQVSGPMIAFELVGQNALATWRSLIGHKDPQVARAENPSSLRARFGKDIFTNGVHGSSTAEQAREEIDFFFPVSPPRLPCTARYENTTLCIIKPTALARGLIGKIMQSIKDAGFFISAMKMYQLNRVQIQEFLDVYMGVLEEFPSMVEELAAGACLAMEIGSDDTSKNVQKEFRELCGPFDPEIARLLRPHSLRAIYGNDKLSNGVHCTDLPDDGLLEVQYFFQILHRN